MKAPCSSPCSPGLRVLLFFLPVNDDSGDAFAVEGGVPEQNFRRLGALDVELQVVFPGESDAAVDLHPSMTDFAVGVGAIRLGD